MLAEHNRTYDKALLCGNGELPEKGDPGSEIQCVGTYVALWTEDPQPGIHTLKSYSSSTVCQLPVPQASLQHHRVAL